MLLSLAMFKTLNSPFQPLLFEHSSLVASFVHPYLQLGCFHKCLPGLLSSGSCSCLNSMDRSGASISTQEEVRA